MTKKERIQLMKELQSDVESVLERLKTTNNKVIYKEESVNVADLHCVDVRFRLELDGTYSYEILIEEAAPHCQELQKLVYAQLPEKWKTEGSPYLEVRTEW